MGRPPRIQYEGACYHIFSRGNRREQILREESDYQAFEDILLDAMRWSRVLLYDWSQMPNHFHFNLETPEGNLAEFMQRLLARYAKYFNRTHHLVGHVFQGFSGTVGDNSITSATSPGLIEFSRAVPRKTTRPGPRAGTAAADSVLHWAQALSDECSGAWPRAGTQWSRDQHDASQDARQCEPMA